MADPLDVRALLEGTTPGPWAVEGQAVMDRFRSRFVALMGTYPEDDPTVANDARLIAAAPDLAAEVLRLRAEREDEADDVLTAWRVRNAALAVAASFLHPGPDHADYTIRRAMVEEWVGEGHDRVAEEDRQRQEALRRMIAAEAEADRYRKALERFGGHHIECDVLEWEADLPCDCGFAAALSGEAPDAG